MWLRAPKNRRPKAVLPAHYDAACARLVYPDFGARLHFEHVTDRDWIYNTLVDAEATRGEVDAAWRAATPGERAQARTQIEGALWWDERQQHLIRGRLAHLREQYPALER